MATGDWFHRQPTQLSITWNQPAGGQNVFSAAESRLLELVLFGLTEDGQKTSQTVFEQASLSHLLSTGCLCVLHVQHLARWCF